MNPETQALYDAAQGNANQPQDVTPSMSEHEAEFSNAPRLRESREQQREQQDADEQPRHRARSQRATTEDVDEIAALTKRLRDAEDSLGVKVERKDGESDRVYNLRRRAELAEARAKAMAPTERAQQAAPPPQPVSDFAEAEPTLEQFKDAPDPYSAWTRATAAWDRRKETHEAKQAEAKTGSEQHFEQAKAAREATYAEFGKRVAAFRVTTPDYDAVVKAAEDRPTPLALEFALVDNPDGPRYIYHLAKNQALWDEIFLMADGKPPTRQHVDTLRRLLTARMPAADTGSAASGPRPLAHRPPNPVRTVPQTQPSRAPGDAASMSDHERFYGSSGRRR